MLLFEENGAAYQVVRPRKEAKMEIYQYFLFIDFVNIEHDQIFIRWGNRIVQLRFHFVLTVLLDERFTKIIV